MLEEAIILLEDLLGFCCSLNQLLWQTIFSLESEWVILMTWA